MVRHEHRPISINPGALMVQVADPFGSGSSGGGSLGQQLGFSGGTVQSQGVEIVPTYGWSDAPPIPSMPGNGNGGSPAFSISSRGAAFMLGLVVLGMSGFRA